MIHRFLFLWALLFSLHTHAQIDQKKLDSLARSIDSSAKMNRSWQDSFAKVQDSIYQAAVKENKNSRGNDLAKKNEKNEGRNILLRWAIGVVLLVTAFVLLRRRKT